MVVFEPLVRALVQTVVERGPSESQLFGQARIAKRFGHVSLTDFAQLVEAALRLTDDAALGLRLADPSTVQRFDVVGHMLGHAACLRDAIEIAMLFGRTVIDNYHLTLHEHIDTATLRFEFMRSASVADRLLADFVMAGMQRLLLLFVGKDARITRVCFDYQEPVDSAPYRQHFRGPVAFSQPTTELTFPRAYLASASPYANAELLAVLREHAEKVVARTAGDRSFAAAVRRYLAACVPARMPSMSEAARELGLSARSLRRRLAQERVSYRDLLRTAVSDAAVQMLTTRERSVRETAAAIGFSDVSSFERAFKRWTGQTPSQFRRGVFGAKLTTASDGSS